MRRVLFPLCLPLVACGVEKISGDEGGTQCVPEPVQAIFTARCAMPGCHPSGGAYVSLADGDSAAIIGQPATQSPLPFVEIGSIERSYLAHKIMESPPMPIQMTRMPMGANFEDPALQNDIAVILGWIAGAELGACAGGTDTNAEASGSGSESGSTGEPPIMQCGLDDLDPAAANPIVSGDGAMQIPTEIGTILHDNCGCHYSMGPLAGGAVPYPSVGPFQISTWDEWQGMVNDNLTVIQSALNRVDFESENLMMFPGVVMPQPTYCHTGDGETMPLAERATLVEWLRAGAPDGASWPP